MLAQPCFCCWAAALPNSANNEFLLSPKLKLPYWCGVPGITVELFVDKNGRCSDSLGQTFLIGSHFITRHNFSQQHHWYYLAGARL
jgi:hypothetical protein